MVRRTDKVAFFSSDSEIYKRMTNFTEITQSKNAIEYSRQYVDEDFERTDIVGYSPSISYNFDYAGEKNEVHKAIVDITDNEKLGDDAIVSIVLVDMTDEAHKATHREFSIIPDTEGDSMEAYTYTGTMRANGPVTIGKATTSDEWKTCTFTEGLE